MNKTWKGPRHGGWQRAHARASGAAVYVAGHLPSGSRHPVCHEQRPGEPRETAPKTNPDPVVPAAGFAHSPEEARGHGQGQPLPCSSRPRSLLRTRAAAGRTPPRPTPASYLDHPAPFASFLRQERVRQLQHLPQPVHHHHLQLRARRAGRLSREGGTASRPGPLRPRPVSHDAGVGRTGNRVASCP